MTAFAPAIARPTGARSRIAFDVISIVAGSLIVAGLAQISIVLHFTPVPITGQTLGVLLVGASLGAWRGGASLLLYLAEGAAGAHFFAQGKHGVSILAASSASGGYLWGFVVAAIVVGFLSQRGWDRNIGSSIGAMLIGEVIIYAFGVPWLSAALHVSSTKAYEYGLYPFIIGDAIKLGLAAAVLPTAWRFVKKGREG
ncbi:MAG: biotin transporter BioY [Actinobacteria bacterium]|nr:MAG: biotin transporter BioY [Actinomycetota bacterium]